MAFLQPASISRFLFSLRPFVIGFLVLIFLIPLSMVTGIVQDRIENYRVAVDGISSSWARSQDLIGPILIIPYSETVASDNYDPQTQKLERTTEKVEKISFVLPEKLKINTSWKTEERERGIYNIPVYTATVALTGYFSVGETIDNIRNQKDRVIGQPYLSVFISDVRGITGTTMASLAEKSYEIRPGSNIPSLTGGFHIPLSLTDLEGEKRDFDVRFNLKGLDGFAVVPAGSFVEMEGASDWPHPSFNGQFLPSEKTITADGFQAKWQTGILATNVTDQANSCLNGNTGDCVNLRQNAFGVAFFQPVDIYTQSLRATKYGILFVALTFAIFYISEILQGTRVYTMQLMLVGLALAIFYLLLISLSEILGFLPAYVTASAATIGLLTFYSSFVLKEKRGGVMVGGILTILYSVLYFNLSSEDYALLMGSVLLFVALGVTMFLTRNVDWTNVGKPLQESSDKP